MCHYHNLPYLTTAILAIGKLGITNHPLQSNYLINHFFLTILSFLFLTTTTICFFGFLIHCPLHYFHAHTLFHSILAPFDLHCQLLWAWTCAWFLLKSQKCQATIFYLAKKMFLVIYLSCRILVYDRVLEQLGKDIWLLLYELLVFVCLKMESLL